MKSVLVVEDDPLSRELLADWLEAQGYACYAAATLGAAREIVISRKPDLVLLDVNLGPEDGLELAHWLRAEPSFAGIPVIVVTAHAMVAEKERIERSGCSAFVSKPVDFGLLKSCMERFLPEASE